MEVNKDLKALIERAWGLHDKLNFEIKNSIEFCRLCSEHGRYCDVADPTPFEERQKLISIRDSLIDVHNMLTSLQGLEAWQNGERSEAFSRLEESRLVLIQLVRKYQGREELDVLRDLSSCFGGGTGRSKWSYFSCFIRRLSLRWKWQKAIGIAFKFLVISASISSVLHLNHTRRRKLPLFLDSTEADSKSPLNVFHGRG